MTAASAPGVHIGPSGWSYDDWNGVVYPARRARGFDALAYIASFFDAVEVNVSFYRPVAPPVSEGWVRRVERWPGFRFAFKLHQSFTHLREDYDRSAVAGFLDGLRPVLETRRMACLLIQFPWSFRRSAASREWVKRLAGDFATCPLVVEFRHDSWNVAETLEELRAMGIGWCNIDQPALSHCIPPTAYVTAPLGYVRLHGRRSDTWFATDAPAHERYNYLYKDAELREWTARIGEMGGGAETIYVFANNHYRGQGPANALQLRAMLEGRRVRIPPPLVERYPELADIADADLDGRFEETLF